MTENQEAGNPMRKCHEQMLKLVAKGFYNELINYGVNKAEVLSVAGHLLDNIAQTGGPANKNAEYYNKIFTVEDIHDDWTGGKRLGLHQVSIAPLDLALVPTVASWLRAPGVRDSFYPKFPDSEGELKRSFQSPSREFFCIYYEKTPAGIIGAENIDTESARLEMRKLVGDAAMHGKGIGKRATFLFLYYVFVLRKFQKVYIHTLDINIRNLNLNGKFGFELEGVFLEEAMIGGKSRDVIRMALFRPVWLELFS